MIPKSLVPTFWLQAIYCAIIVFLTYRAKRGLKIPEIRKVPGLDAIDEAIGRATEMGKPTHYCPGTGDINEADTLASFSILRYVANQSAKYSADLVVTNRRVVVYPITEEIVKQSYIDAGQSDLFKPENVRFFSEDQWAYASACIGMLEREKPAANILIGSFSAEALMLAESGSQINAIQIAGTSKTSQIPFFVVACDYCLIGEELYAAGAYLSHDPNQMATLVAQDIGKMFAIALVTLGLILAAVSPENNWILRLIK